MATATFDAYRTDRPVGDIVQCQRSMEEAVHWEDLSYTGNHPHEARSGPIIRSMVISHYKWYTTAFKILGHKRND